MLYCAGHVGRELLVESDVGSDVSIQDSLAHLMVQVSFQKQGVFYSSDFWGFQTKLQVLQELDFDLISFR